MAQQQKRRPSATKSAGNAQTSSKTGNLSEEQKTGSLARWVNIQDVSVSPKQPRRYFDPAKLEQLVASIRQHGILEPLIVRPIDDDSQYEIVAGERRFRAAKQIGLQEIPAIIRKFGENEAFELALLENLQRDDLNPIDETEGLLTLLSQALKLSADDIISLLNRAANAQKRGQPLTDNVTRQIELIDSLFMTVGRLNRESFRTNRLPLLNLPDDVLEVLREGELEYTKGKAIARVTDFTQRRQLMQQAIDERLSLSELKRRSRHLQGTVQFRAQIDESDSDSDSDIAMSLREEFNTIARLKTSAWDDVGKRERLEKLLIELKAVLET